MAEIRVIGIDAGGSKTLGLLVDGRGTVLERATGGGSNVRSVGEERASQNLAAVLTPLLARGAIAAVCIGAAGLGRDSDRSNFQAIAEKLLPNNVKLDLRNDAEIVLRAGTKSRPAMAVIVGSGSLFYGEDAHGARVRAGGYGAVIGDIGGAFQIGMAAVAHAAATLDGVAVPDKLSVGVLEALNAKTVNDLIERVHVWPPDIAVVASLASLVGEAYEAGDSGAVAIVESMNSKVARYAETVAQKVRDAGPLPVILSGGAFSAVPALLAAVEEGVRRTGPCELQRLALEPAHGAALVALDSLGFRG